MITEIEDVNRSEVLTQFSQEDLNEEVIHDLQKFEEEFSEKRTHVRDMPKGSDDTEADPQVDIPEEISPKSSTNLEIVFRKLGAIIEMSMESNRPRN